MDTLYPRRLVSGVIGALTVLSSIGFAGSAAPVTIGNMTLSGTEVPSIVRVEGEQNLSVVTLPGGSRSIQAMGDNPSRLTLAGMFIGPGAQQRAEQMLAMRKAGAQIRLTVLRISAVVVVVASFSYTLQDKGAVCPYQLTLEVLPTLAAPASGTTANLSTLVGSDIATAITTVASVVSDIATYARTAAGISQNVAGQLQPVASLIGLGGPLAAASDRLSTVGLLSQVGQNFASVPSSAAVMTAGLNAAGASLMTTIGNASVSLSGIGAAAPAGELVADRASLVAAAGHAGILAGAVQVGALVNRASGNAALATSAASLPVPIVHA